MQKRGFTLIEIIVVIIILGILASLALPRYMKTVKKARVAEAISNIGAIRGAEIRYYQEYNALVTGSDLTPLDIENLNDSTKFPAAYFTYSISGTSLENMVIRAEAKPGKAAEGIWVEYNASTGKLTDNLAEQ